MKVMIIGGTGLLGLEASKNLLNEGHEVVAFALPPVPKNVKIPKNMKLILKDFISLSDKEMLEYMNGCDGLIFAAGIDERVEGKAPIYDKYYNYNVKYLRTLLVLAKKAKISRVVVLGSYFSYLNRLWNDLDLYAHHPYIRSRVEQAKLALSFADKSTIISVLELPYIFGVQEGRKPVWTILAKKIRKMKIATMYPSGGSAMITVKQVGTLISRVLIMNNESGNIPVGYYNLTWKDMLKHFHKAMNIRRIIISIPIWISRIWFKRIQKQLIRKGLESGLNYHGLAEIMSRLAYVNNREIREKYLIEDEDIEDAIVQSVQLSIRYLNNEVDLVDMKYE